MGVRLLEVKLAKPEDFLKVKETLTRMGLACEDVLTQICHILHKRGRYYIVHYKEMLVLDGEVVDISEKDMRHRNSIAALLHDWNLCSVIDKSILSVTIVEADIKVIPFKDKGSWRLTAHYVVGQRKGQK